MSRARVLVASDPSSGSRQAVVDEDEFVAAPAVAAVEFFTAMRAFTSAGLDYRHELERAAALR